MLKNWEKTEEESFVTIRGIDSHSIFPPLPIYMSPDGCSSILFMRTLVRSRISPKNGNGNVIFILKFLCCLRRCFCSVEVKSSLHLSHVSRAAICSTVASKKTLQSDNWKAKSGVFGRLPFDDDSKSLSGTIGSISIGGIC